MEIDRLNEAFSDRYHIERELGRGGMAVVYLARDKTLGRDVALKVLLPELAASIGAARFLREIEIAASLNHPNILTLHDSGQTGGQAVRRTGGQRNSCTTPCRTSRASRCATGSTAKNNSR